MRAPPEERRAEQEEERQKLTEACRTLSLHALGQQSGAGVREQRGRGAGGHGTDLETFRRQFGPFCARMCLLNYGNQMASLFFNTLY